MTVQLVTQYLTAQLAQIYDGREAANIAALVMEDITGWKRIDRVLNRQHVLLPAQTGRLEKYTAQLLQHRPVQYVLGEAWFYNMKFHVDEHVLIPRPETEELVDWVVQDVLNRGLKGRAIKILDVGTGSGCIAVALKKELPAARVYACDISREALEIAGKNAVKNGVQVNCLQTDFLQQAQRDQLPVVDVLISNPPYIPLKNSEAMHPNVLRYEPHGALFVADNDPLVFYRAIAGFARTHLLQNGAVYAEIHEDMARATSALFHAHDFYKVEVRKDLQGKDRMVRAERKRQPVTSNK